MMYANSTSTKKLTPEQIVEDALFAVNNGWGYIQRKTGQIWTEEEQDAVEADPTAKDQTKLYGRKWIGHRVADGSGLVVWIFRRHGGYIPHGCNSIYERYCDLKGEIKDGSILRPGCLVFKISYKYENPVYHVGIYIGGGKIVEAHGTAKGVIQSTLFGWSHYGYPNGVEW